MSVSSAKSIEQRKWNIVNDYFIGSSMTLFQPQTLLPGRNEWIDDQELLVCKDLEGGHRCMRQDIILKSPGQTEESHENPETE
jgi:hypothetical protein